MTNLYNRFDKEPDSQIPSCIWSDRKFKIWSTICPHEVIFMSVIEQLNFYYENMPIQIYWKFNHQKMIIFRQKILKFFMFLLKT